MKSPAKWVEEVGYPELWEAIDEALMATAHKHADAGRLAQAWVAMPKRVRAHLHGQLRQALRRRMSIR